MKILRISILIKIIGLSVLASSMISCQKEFEIVATIYENNFEDGEPWIELTNAQVLEFNDSRMLGNYHDGGFEVHMIDLPDHQILQFEFDLYIIDSWDGNNVSSGGPDKWFMEVKKEWDFNQPSVEDFKFETTFSNAGDPSRGLCFQELRCIPQSYPGPFPSFNLPRTDAVEEVNGFCLHRDRSNGAMRYRISQSILHDYSELHLYFYDSLVQDNAFSEPCDESWAIDNLSIRAFDEI